LIGVLLRSPQVPEIVFWCLLTSALGDVAVGGVLHGAQDSSVGAEA